MSHIIEGPDYEISLENEPWQFYYAGVWERPDGYYLSTDSGCSCPTPWESHTEDSRTGPLTWDQVKEELRSLAAGAYQDAYATESVNRFITEKENNNG